MSAGGPDQPSLALDGFEHRSAGSGARSIHYVTAGATGTPVVLLHGFPETWFGWRALIPPLSNHHRIIAPDLTGLGGSSRPPDGYEKTAVAADISGVLDAERVTDYHVVGADMGGLVGFALAMTDRARVRSFTFIASALPGFGLERLYDHSAIGVNAWYWTLFQHPIFGPMLTDGHQREMLTNWAYRGSALNPDAIPAEAIEIYLQSYADPEGWRAAIQYYATLEQDARDNARLIDEHGLLDVPTLGINGEQDGRLSTATLAQVARNVRGVLIPDCKHWVAEEQPQRLSELLLGFFADVQDPGKRSTMTINPGGHVDEVTAEIRADAAGVCFVQVWQVADRDAQQRWLAMMAENMHILQARPGFISMTLHASLDGTRIVVYAQWESDAALRASVDDPEAIVAHEKMAEVGTPDGGVYRVNSIFAPLVLAPNPDPEGQSE